MSSCSYLDCDHDLLFPFMDFRMTRIDSAPNSIQSLFGLTSVFGSGPRNVSMPILSSTQLLKQDGEVLNPTINVTRLPSDVALS